jgi:hypothetical protein
LLPSCSFRIHQPFSRENKKFIYRVAKEGARAREYEDALQWLVDAQLVRKIYRSNAPGLPISAYDDLTAFKLYLIDVGLLRRLALLAPSAFSEGNRLYSKRVRIPGTEDMVLTYRNPVFHIKGAVKGIVIGVVTALVSASVVFKFHQYNEAKDIPHLY